MKAEKFNKILNYIMIVILIALWGCIFFIHGISGAISWVLVKLFMAPIGAILILVNLILLCICLVKKKKVTQKIISLILSVLLAFPILMLFNVLKVRYPADINKVTPSITVRWPLNEKATVGWGGDTIEINVPHVIWASERWAYDLVMEPSNIDSKNLNDFGIYDKEVVAPVSGTIIAAYDEENDILPNTENFISMEGNHVYIKIDETGTFLLLNHLKKDSVPVKVGDHVKEGDVIGKVGNSGSTSEPHLHIHHQRQDPTKTIHPTFAEGLPLYFKDINGKAMPEKGTVITPKK
ncbi:M23 family metallopeptidase [Clostridium brassicae]|uniref:M23 family metallopeptidase n=1 Tax=Clostridium brassicae TaxID=2999072 RepID=A0ABT4DBX3_9CLOT|nr:M23 family metallopeptidase [Clostridium brassicae]MCY6959800.1 M23 family metallopeptidase [Clostridium brassicae]